MSIFEDRHRDHVMGSLAMFDRLIFRGHLMPFYYPGAVRAFLWHHGVPLTGFKDWVRQCSECLCAHAVQVAAEAGRPCIYLDRQVTRDNGETKEELARKIAQRDGITEGLICVLRTVEPCGSFKLRRNDHSGQLEVVSAKRACLQLYFYFIDAELGFIHVKLQTWLPFTIQIWINGREWLAGQLDDEGVGYRRYENALLIVSAKHPRIEGRLLSFRARYVEPPGDEESLPAVEITLPDGFVVRSDAGDIDDVLSSAFGSPVHFSSDTPQHPAMEVATLPGDGRLDSGIGWLAPGTFQDAAPLSLLTTATLSALRSAGPTTSFDPRRFRANFVIRTSPQPQGFVENGWNDRGDLFQQWGLILNGVNADNQPMALLASTVGRT
jgi:hypothetical protein